jgi:hypothetical protein
LGCLAAVSRFTCSRSSNRQLDSIPESAAVQACIAITQLVGFTGRAGRCPARLSWRQRKEAALPQGALQSGGTESGVAQGGGRASRASLQSMASAISASRDARSMYWSNSSDTCHDRR